MICAALLSILPLWFKSAFSTVAWVLSSLILISALASWIPQVKLSRVGDVLFALTEPVLAPVRKLLRLIPALADLPLDLSPLVAYFLIRLLSSVVVSL